MKLQSITLCVEKEYEKSRWCLETLKGLYEAVSKHKMALEIKYDKDMVKSRKDKMIMILGTTQSWFVDVLSKLNPYNFRIILISNAPFDLRSKINRVVFDREEDSNQGEKRTC